MKRNYDKEFNFALDHKFRSIISELCVILNDEEYMECRAEALKKLTGKIVACPDNNCLCRRDPADFLALLDESSHSNKDPAYAFALLLNFLQSVKHVFVLFFLDYADIFTFIDFF